MSFISEFKKFAMRGNVIDLAVGVIIGSAFGKIVSSLVADVFMPIIGLLVGGVNFQQWVIVLKHAATDAAGAAVPAVTLNIGNFMQATFDFIIIALAIFMFIRLINRINKKDEASETPTAPSKEETLLSEIRDILKEKK